MSKAAVVGDLKRAAAISQAVHSPGGDEHKLLSLAAVFVKL